MGYHRAGFDVFGVDLNRAALSRYPFHHRRADAVQYIRDHGAKFDAIAASPPCKVHTVAAVLHTEDLDSMLFPIPTHTDLIPDTREALEATGKPWVIENVVGAGLRDPLVLCGTMFGLGAECVGAGWRQLWRHREFESNVQLTAPGPCDHKTRAMSIFGGGGGLRPNGDYYANVPEAQIALDCPWMSQHGVSQAIPPAYTKHIGRQLLEAIGESAA